MESDDRIQMIRSIVAEIEDGLLKFGRKSDTFVPGRIAKMIRYANEDAYGVLHGKLASLKENLVLLAVEIDQELEELRDEVRDEQGEDK